MGKSFAKDLQLGHTYLVTRDGFDVSAITIELVTKEAYNIRWTSGGLSWELKENFERLYYFVEDISDFVAKPNVTSTNLEQCYACRGTGKIPSFNSTSGYETCPVCKGLILIAKS